MKKLIIVLTALSLSACATSRTRSSDPVMRVTVDAQSMTKEIYTRLVHSLVSSGKFIVVDRGDGFKAVAHEQEMQHTNTRFGENEKYALWGKLFGVGGIFVGSEKCKNASSIFRITAKCLEDLTLINASTGEIMAAADGYAYSDNIIEPDWDDVVDKLIASYPRVFVDKHDPNLTVKYDKSLLEYREKTVIENRKPSMEMQREDYIK